MDIKVLGPGCRKCEATKKLIAEVADELGADVRIEAVRDIMKITEYDVMSTPGVVIDGEVVSSGKIPSKGEIEAWLVKRSGGNK